MESFITTPIVGFFVGILVGLTGVGGAALLTPILVFLGIKPILAIGTDMVYNSITKLFGTIQHIKQKNVNLTLVGHFSLGSIPGVLISGVVITRYGEYFKSNERVIINILGFTLVIVALAMLLQILIFKNGVIGPLNKKQIGKRRILSIILCFIFGFVFGLTSIGSGSLFALVIYYMFRTSAAQLVGTDIAHAFLLASVSGAIHILNGNIDFQLMFGLLIGSIPGVILGSKLSSRVPSQHLKIIIIGIILISGIQLVIK